MTREAKTGLVEFWDHRIERPLVRAEDMLDEAVQNARQELGRFEQIDWKWRLMENREEVYKRVAEIEHDYPDLSSVLIYVHFSDAFHPLWSDLRDLPAGLRWLPFSYVGNYRVDIAAQRGHGGISDFRMTAQPPHGAATLARFFVGHWPRPKTP